MAESSESIGGVARALELTCSDPDPAPWMVAPPAAAVAVAGDLAAELGVERADLEGVERGVVRLLGGEEGLLGDRPALRALCVMRTLWDLCNMLCSRGL